ncbi:MAG: radical SAM family heme chaperone HemW [Deltaproteobacteria bacterium]|nr:radical SAM family heme chaperone HemW [Deltaproteobacteria bacterium]
MKTLGFYIHIPFCESKCTYCDFNSGYLKEEDRYLKALIQEMTSYKKTFEHHTIDTIFLGGGTPSLYSSQSLEKILNTVFKNYKIKNPEITIECNPNSLTLEKLKDLKKSGFNRISLGAQSFQDHQLKNLTRLHTSDQIRVALNNIQKAQFKNFSFDLMYGLPLQSFEEFQKDLEEALLFQPPHFSFYNLTLEKIHPLYKKLPSNDLSTEMHLYAKELLESKGYDHYEVSNYAQKGCYSKHNLKYWNYEEYLGVGAGASSYLKTPPSWVDSSIPYGIRFTGVKNPLVYAQKHLEGEFPYQDIEYLTQKQNLTDYLMNRLRLQKPLDLTSLNKIYSIDFINDFSYFWVPQKDRGLLDIRQNMLSLTSKGRLFLDEIIMDFI